MIEAVQVQNILKRSHENKLAHAFLLETNDINRCYKDILSLLKQLNCPKEYDVNCSNECNICNLFKTNNLPSFITISPDGKNIKKQQILDMMDKFNTKPVFSKYNMYVIKEAEAFNASSANTLLKFLEEPEDNILGFFITTNKEKYKIEMFKNNSTVNLIKIVGIIEDTLKHIKYNGNIDLILDKFVIEMRDCYE